MYETITSAFTSSPYIPSEEHTIKSIFDDFKRFNESFLNLQPSKQTKPNHAKTTQNQSHSIILEHLAHASLQCITRATMHIVLGVTRQIVDWIVALYGHVEKRQQHPMIHFNSEHPLKMLTTKSLIMNNS